MIFCQSSPKRLRDHPHIKCYAVFKFYDFDIYLITWGIFFDNLHYDTEELKTCMQGIMPIWELCV